MKKILFMSLLTLISTSYANTTKSTECNDAHDIAECHINITLRAKSATHGSSYQTIFANKHIKGGSIVEVIALLERIFALHPDDSKVKGHYTTTTILKSGEKIESRRLIRTPHSKERCIRKIRFDMTQKYAAFGRKWYQHPFIKYFIHCTICVVLLFYPLALLITAASSLSVVIISKLFNHFTTINDPITRCSITINLFAKSLGDESSYRTIVENKLLEGRSIWEAAEQLEDIFARIPSNSIMEGNCTSTITLQSGKQIVSNIKINPTLSKKKCIRNITFTIIKKYKLAIDTWNDVLWRYMKVYFNTGTKILFMTVYIFFINIAVITFFTVLLANPFSLLVFLYPFVVSIYVTSILPYAGFAVCIQEYYKDQEISLIEEQDVAL